MIPANIKKSSSQKGRNLVSLDHIYISHHYSYLFFDVIYYVFCSPSLSCSLTGLSQNALLSLINRLIYLLTSSDWLDLSVEVSEGRNQRWRLERMLFRRSQQQSYFCNVEKNRNCPFRCLLYLVNVK